MTREEQIEDKKRQLAELCKQQMIYIEKSIKVSKLPKPKRAITNFKRAFRVMAYAMAVRNIEMQKQIIAATPIAPKFKSGRIAIVGEKGDEKITSKNGINFTPPKININQ